jgi:hypothetical protein
MHVRDSREYIRVACRIGLVEPGIGMSSTRKMPKDPVSTGGQWVKRAEFRGHKSFGYFCCHECSGKNWVSAHAFKNMRQGCKQCYGYTLARYLWVNNDQGKGLAIRAEPKLNKREHIEELCEKCQRGDKCVPKRAYTGYRAFKWNNHV